MCACRSSATSGLGGFGLSGSSVISSVEAPRSRSVWTVSIQSAVLLVRGRSPLPTAAQPSGVSFQVVSAGFDVGAAVEKEANGLDAAVVGGGVECGAAVVAAGFEREAEVEHEADCGGVAVFGRAKDCCTLFVGQP